MNTAAIVFSPCKACDPACQVAMLAPISPSLSVRLSGIGWSPTLISGGTVAVPPVMLSVSAPAWLSSTLPPSDSWTDPLLCVSTFTGSRLDRLLSADSCWSSSDGLFGEVCSPWLMVASWLNRLLAVLTFSCSAVPASLIVVSRLVEAVWNVPETVSASDSTVSRAPALLGFAANVPTSWKNWFMEVWMSPLFSSALEILARFVASVLAAWLAVVAVRITPAAKPSAARVTTGDCTPKPDPLDRSTWVVRSTDSAA